MDLLPQEIKIEARQQLKNVFDTFKRQARFIIESDGETIQMDYSNHSPSDDLPRPDVEILEVEARIWFPDPQKYKSYSNIEQTNIHAGQDMGTLKVQLEIEHLNSVKKARKFRFLGENYYLLNEWRPLGIFEFFDYIEATLRKET